MAEQIKKSDIINDDVLPSLKKGLQENLSVLEKMDVQLKSVAKSFTTLTNAEKKRLEGITKLNQQQLQAERLVKEKIKNDTERVKQQQHLVRLEALEQKQKVAIRKENERLLKVKQRLEKNLTDESNAYKRLVKQTRDYKNESKRLGAELLSLESSGKRNTKAYRELSRAYKQVTSSAKAGDKQLKKLDRTVGDNFRNVGNYKKAIGGLRSALGSLGLAFGLREVVRNVSSTIVDFDQAVTDLSAISGKSKEELSGLTDQAKQLGATTQFTASEITGLQIELAKLGFTTKEIQDSTGGIANFASATGVEIPRASKLAGSALRAFNLEAKDIDRVVSTLGVATTKTALDFSQLETGLSTVAPVASAFGFSIEDTTALLGQLSNAGFDASSSATATRNILLNLADVNGDLAKKLGRPVKSAKDLSIALQELDDKGIDLAESLELTDKRSVAAFSTFLKGAETLPQLTDSITNVNDELTEMADKRLDSVEGQLKLLNSAWEGFILQQSEAGGAVDKLKSAIGFLANNLGTILGVLGRLIKVFISYRAVLFSLKIKDHLKNTKLFNKALRNTGESVGKASAGTKKLGSALKSIGWAVLISYAYDYANALWDAVNGNLALVRSEKLKANELKKANDNFNKFSKDIDKSTQKKIDDLEKQINIEIAKGGDTEALQLKLQREKIKILKEEKQITVDKFAVVQEEAEKQYEALKLAERIKKQSESTGQSFVEAMQDFRDATFDLNPFGEMTNYTKIVDELQAKYDGVRSEMVSYLELSKQIEEAIQDVVYEETIQNITIDRNAEATKKQTKANEDKNDTLEETNKHLEENLRIRGLIQDIESKEIENILKKKNEDVNNIVDAEVRRLLNEGGEINYEGIDERLKEIKKIREQAEQDEFERLVNEAKETIKNKQELDLKIELLELEHQNKMAEIAEDYVSRKEEISDRLNSSFPELVKTTNDKIIKNENDLYSQLNKLQQQITDGLKQNIDKRIELRKREFDEAKNLQDFYQELANNGNINAQQSITKQIELQREALKEQERLERQKAKLELISSGLNTFSTELEKGKSPQEAFATTVLTSQALVQFLGNLNAFEKGTDNAPKGLAWTQEKGAEVITDKHGNIKSLGSSKGASLTMLDAGDKVYNAQKSKSIIENLRSSKDGELIRRVKESGGNSYDLMRLESLMKEQTQALKNKKEIEIHWDSVQRGLVERVKRGKDITTTIYKTR